MSIAAAFADDASQVTNQENVAREKGPDVLVSDVAALVQTMREEQMNTLKSIADGVQQLQSQILVLGETVTSSDSNMCVCLERLAGLEVRIGSIPVPMKPPGAAAATQRFSGPSGGSLGSGDYNAPGRRGGAQNSQASAYAAGAAYTASSAVANRGAPPPPPPAAASPSRVPTWLDRQAQGEPARPHFMRHTPQAGPSASRSPSSSVAPKSVTATASTSLAPKIATPSEPATPTPEEAAKEAQRKAFAEDRARMQARIAARRAGNGITTTISNSNSNSPVAPGTAPVRQGLVQATSVAAAEPLPTPSPATNAASAVATDSPPRNSAFDGQGPSGVGAADNEALWLERERLQREKKEKARKEALERERLRREEEKARLERERAEAKRRKEEEEARLAKEAEEARAQEEARREREAKRQAKTRVLMSSLFDKDEADNTLFGGLGAALPAGSSVFDDGLGSRNAPAPVSSASRQEPGHEATAKLSPPTPLPSSLGAVGSEGGSLFAGIDDVSQRVPTKGMFDEIDAPSAAGDEATHGADPFSMQPDNKSRASGMLFDSALGGSLSSTPPGLAGPPDETDELDKIFSGNGSGTDASASPHDHAGGSGAMDEYSEFLTTESAKVSGTSLETALETPSGGAGTRGNIDDIFSTPFTTEKASASGIDGGRATSLFDRPEFSIDSGDDYGENIFARTRPAPGVTESDRSFLTSLEDADLASPGVDKAGAQAGRGAKGAEGMVDVRL